MSEKESTTLELVFDDWFVERMERGDINANVQYRFIVDGDPFRPSSVDETLRAHGLGLLEPLLDGVEAIEQGNNYMMGFPEEPTYLVYHLATEPEQSMALVYPPMQGTAENYAAFERPLTEEELEGALSSAIESRRAIAGAIVSAGEELYEEILEINPDLETNQYIGSYHDSLEDARIHYRSMLE